MMKTVGLLGGMSWESTVTYYQAINRGVKERLGGLHSAQIVLLSVDFDSIETLQRRGDWPATADILSKSAQKIEAAGADFMLICTNTMHKVYQDIDQAVQIPVLHIADATGKLLAAKSIRCVGLLGTKFTMEEAFYRQRLSTQFGVDVVIPNNEERLLVHNVIYGELCQGVIKPDSKRKYLRIIESLRLRGAEAVILGCTEIGLLINQRDTDVELVDTVAVHAQAAVDALFQSKMP